MYRRAIMIQPTSAQMHFGLGRLLLTLGKKDDGRTELQRALELKLTPEQTKQAQDLLDKNP